LSKWVWTSFWAIFSNSSGHPARGIVHGCKSETVSFSTHILGTCTSKSICAILEKIYIQNLTKTELRTKIFCSFFSNLPTNKMQYIIYCCPIEGDFWKILVVFGHTEAQT
jgi:hypothetical protein